MDSCKCGACKFEDNEHLVYYPDSMEDPILVSFKMRHPLLSEDLKNKIFAIGVL